MATFTTKDIEFLSNRDLINILRSVLDEIDIVVSIEAHRSTTYLAVSAIEGVFKELIKLLDIQPHQLTEWPPYKGSSKKKDIDDLALADMVKILGKANALPPDFDKELYTIVKKYRNYIHPAAELKDLKPINQSIAQLALACLNALIEMYQPLRFTAKQKWRLEYGLTQVPTDKIIHMPQVPGDFVSLLLSELSAHSLKEIKFSVNIPQKAIFNFVYNYFSRDDFMMARIEGRDVGDGRGYDNGRIHCTHWRVWNVTDHYTLSSEPKASQREHDVKITFAPVGNFVIAVDGKPLVLDAGASWDFNPQGRIGFLSEHGLVSILDLEVQT